MVALDIFEKGGLNWVGNANELNAGEFGTSPKSDQTDI
jgi:hypothetical protein